MTTDTNKGFLDALSKVNATKRSRERAAFLILADAAKMTLLVETAMTDGSRLGAQAWWVLEMVYLEQPELLDPYLDFIIANSANVCLESALRPMAKVLALHLEAGAVSEHYYEPLTEKFFLWLMGPHKVAAKAYSMSGLFELGKKIPWVHNDLALLLEHEYREGSAAYKARARMILEEIRKYHAQGNS